MTAAGRGSRPAAPVHRSPLAAVALPSGFVRLVWIVVLVLLVVALGAWGTTCTGPRPRPTGETIPTGAVTTTPPDMLAPAPDPAT